MLSSYLLTSKPQRQSFWTSTIAFERSFALLSCVVLLYNVHKCTCMSCFGGTMRSYAIVSVIDNSVVVSEDCTLTHCFQVHVIILLYVYMTSWTFAIC